jgi:hypothetical protein
MIQEVIEKNKGLLFLFETWARIAGCVLAAYGAFSIINGVYLYWYKQNLFGDISPYQMMISIFQISAFQFIFPAIFLFGVAAMVRRGVDRERPLPWLVRNGHVMIYVYVGLYGAASIWAVGGYAARYGESERVWPDNYEYLLQIVRYLLALPKLLLWVCFAIVLRKGVALVDGSQGRLSLREAVEQNKRLLHFLANAAGLIGLMYVALGAIEAHAYWAKYTREAAEMIRWANSGTDLVVQYFLPAVLLFGIYGLVQCILDRGYPILPVLTYGDKLIYTYVALKMLSPALMFVIYHPQGSSLSHIPVLAAMVTTLIISLVPLVAWVLFGMIVRKGADLVKESRVMVQAQEA